MGVRAVSVSVKKKLFEGSTESRSRRKKGRQSLRVRAMCVQGEGGLFAFRRHGQALNA